MRFAPVLIVMAMSLAALGQSTGDCRLAGNGSTLEVAIKVPHLDEIPEETQATILPRVKKEVAERLPFVSFVEPSDQPRLVIELLVDASQRVLWGTEREGEGPEVVQKHVARIRARRINCEGQLSVYKNCPGVKVVERVFEDAQEIYPEEAGELVEFFVNTISRRICEIFGAPTGERSASGASGDLRSDERSP